MKDKLFHSLYDTLEYHRACPLCSVPLTPHRESSGDQVDFNGRLLSIKNEEYKIILNINSCSISVEQVFSHTMYEANQLGYKFSKQHKTPLHSIISGQLILAMDFGCMNTACSQYSYMAAIHLDLNEYLFRVAYLNSEWISVEKDGDIFDIKNNFLSNKTKYIRHSKTGKTGSCEIPLIPLNISNPEETLARLQKLVIFT